MIARKFVDVFEVLTLKTYTPRLVKVIDESTPAKRVLDKVVERAQRVHPHLLYLESVRVVSLNPNWSEALQLETALART